MKPKRVGILILTIIFTLASSLSTYAGSWKSSENAWKYLDDSGKAYTGWLKEGESWYFLCPPDGKMLTGWNWIDGKCYYFATAGDKTHPEGKMYLGEVTPDGFTVSLTGAWTVNGIEQYSPGKGILTKAATHLSSGGSGGGSSGGSGGSGGSGSSGSSGSKHSKTSTQASEGQKDQIVEGDSPEEEEIVVIEPKKESKDSNSVPIASPSDAKTEKDYEEAPDKDPEDGKDVPTEYTITPPDKDEYDDIPKTDVNWFVHFVDSDTHAINILPERSGTCLNGSRISIGFLSKVKDGSGNIWEAEDSPREVTIFGPGDVHIYIEYTLYEMSDEDEEEKSSSDCLNSWIETARLAESMLTGENPSVIPNSRFIAESDGEVKTRLISLAKKLPIDEGADIYIIGKDLIPNGISLKEHYGELIRYSNTVCDTIALNGSVYTVSIFSITRKESEADCLHEWKSKVKKNSSCLSKGKVLYTCIHCGVERVVYSAPLGHLDENLDSVCDRCGERAFDEKTGSQICTVLSTSEGDIEITWTLVDTSYQGGCLYIADSGISAGLLGGYGNCSYEESGVFNYFAYSFANEFSVNGDNLLQITEGGTTAWAAMLSESEAISYRDLMANGDYVTRSNGGSGLIVVKDDLSTFETDPDQDFDVRPAIVLKSPDAGEVSDTHWNLDDTVSYEIDGTAYTFRCIDQNYSDGLENHTVSALFLCDEVIPAGYKGEYRYEDDGTGHFDYVWYPGPIAYFGESNDYKYSNIRAFLDDETTEKVFSAADIQIGIESAYTGATADGKFESTTSGTLKAYPIGYQKMNARLFILSIDEALKYTDYLWKFNGSDTDNPETVTDTTCHSYWLRNPNGTSSDYSETQMAYTVDLDTGNIHPVFVKPDGTTGDSYIDTQTNVGVRPVFTLPQR